MISKIYEKQTKNVEKFKEIGLEIGKILKQNQIILIKGEMHILLTRPLEDCSEMI